VKTISVAHNPGLTPEAAMKIFHILLEDWYSVNKVMDNAGFHFVVQKSPFTGVLVGLTQQEDKTSFAINGSWPSRTGLILGLGPVSWLWLRPGWKEMEEDVGSFIRNAPQFMMNEDQSPGVGIHRYITPMPRSKEEWKKLLTELTPHDPRNRWYLHPQIPSDKLLKATTKYGAGLKMEDVLALGDGTVFGSASSGCLLTTDAICCSVGRSGRGVRWSEIASARVVGSEGIQIRLKDGGKVRISCGQFLLVRDKLHKLLSLVATSNRAGVAMT
jgi:hypothetical protein